MDTYAICPFIKYHRGQIISCEDKVLTFENGKAALDYMHENYNTWDYEKCPHAQNLMKKYEKKKVQK